MTESNTSFAGVLDDVVGRLRDVLHKNRQPPRVFRRDGGPDIPSPVRLDVALGWLGLGFDEAVECLLLVDLLRMRLERRKASEPALMDAELSAIRDMLVEKNRKYGNSALVPVRVFSSASPFEQLLVRIDDKLSRIVRGDVREDEDVELDLIGYLILLQVARSMAVAQATPLKTAVPEVSEDAWRYNPLPYAQGFPYGRIWGSFGKWAVCSAGSIMPATITWHVDIGFSADNDCQNLVVRGDRTEFERVFPTIVATYPELRGFVLRFDSGPWVRVVEFLDGLKVWSGQVS